MNETKKGSKINVLFFLIRAVLTSNSNFKTFVRTKRNKYIVCINFRHFLRKSCRIEIPEEEIVAVACTKELMFRKKQN